ncbi:MAG: histidine kinase dimerization/phospho-acceptor domain-containing protein, partial [Candidatus Riflebacteria bacterium]|nr:histidine kinase dimerization/phospho-acceptor domain-containing protein [Candidatus Riflebacteria bacterium]
MKQRIFVNLFILAVVTALLTSVLISYLMYESNYASMKAQVKKDVYYLAEAADRAGIEYLLAVADLDETDRITLINTDGTVTFDSLADNAAMGNHLYRPEIAAAFAGGYGEAVRRSDTLETQTYYCAVLLDNGMVLRLANDNLSVWGILFSTVNYILASLLIVFVLALIIANRQTKRIIEPINSLNLDSPEHNQIYEEIHPLINRLSKQNRQIDEQIIRMNSQKREFLAITENMNEGLLILSKEGKILSANLSARRFFGLKDNNSVGRHFLELNRSENWQSLIYNALDGNICEQHLNFEGRVYRLLATPSRQEEKLTGAVVLLLDETEKAEADLRRKEFSANVSHELKTPLTAISGYAELISGGLARPEDIPAFASKIYGEAARLREMVDNIIKLSRLDEEKNLPQ